MFVSIQALPKFTKDPIGPGTMPLAKRIRMSFCFFEFVDYFVPEDAIMEQGTQHRMAGRGNGSYTTRQSYLSRDRRIFVDLRSQNDASKQYRNRIDSDRYHCQVVRNAIPTFFADRHAPPRCSHILPGLARKISSKPGQRFA